VCGLPEEHLVNVRGVPATSLPRTAVDLARWVSRKSGVVVLDSAMRLGASRAELEAVLSSCKRWPGIRKARWATEFADPLAASALESVSRVVFADHGLPRPRLQVPIPNPFQPVGIVDFLFEDEGVIGEADGLLKYADDDPAARPDALVREKLRQEALEALGYIVIRWGWADIWNRPEWVVARLENAFRRQRHRRAV
jgi:very-short-patch-repair endonuclease